MEKGQVLFNKLLRKDKEKFKRNFEENRKDCKLESFTFDEYLEEPYRDMDDFLTGAFEWVETPEGAWHWKKLTYKK